jgi:hypothetical protein
MAEQNGNGASESLAAIERLVDVLRQDIDLRMQALERMNELIERRNELIAAQTTDHAERVRAEMGDRLQVEQHRNTRAKWYTGILGVFAVMIGAVLFYMVFEMASDMNHMEDYMYNMGHAEGDERERRRDFKVDGPSYMFTMAEDIRAMRTDIGTMSGEMTAMRGDMGEMRVAIIAMDGSIGTLSGDIGQMSTDITTMNGTMGRMQFDTLLMRQGVGSMSNDTRSMGAPFRVMDSMFPW